MLVAAYAGMGHPNGHLILNSADELYLIVMSPQNVMTSHTSGPGRFPGNRQPRGPGKATIDILFLNLLRTEKPGLRRQ